MKRLGIVLTASAVVVALAGCSVVNQAGSAAVVGDERVSVEQIGVEHAEVRQALNGQPIEGNSADINRQLVNSFIMGTVVDLALAEAGVQVLPGQIAAERARLLKQFGSEKALFTAAAQSAIPPSQLDRALKLSLAYAALVEHFRDPNEKDEFLASQEAERATLALVSKVAAEAGISVSPRYGSWDMENLTILGGTTSDVLVTTEMLAQQAAAQQ